jgi:hypothetical protein
VAENVAVETLDVFDDSEDGTEKDEAAADIQDDEMSLPFHLDLLGCCRREARDAVMEQAGDDDEETEEYDLDEESTCDHVLT